MGNEALVVSRSWGGFSAPPGHQVNMRELCLLGIAPFYFI